MLFSYQNAPGQRLPARAERFVAAAQELKSPTGMILGPEALDSYLDKSGVGEEVHSLISAVTDAESMKRVDIEIRRRVVTGRLPDDVGSALQEIVEVLGLHQQDMSVAEIPLIAALYTDAHVTQEPVILNVLGAKQLADAVRQLWSRILVSPYPKAPVNAAIIVYRMPPADVTAHVSHGERIAIRAGEGWGRLVGAEEKTDAYSVDPSTLEILQREVVRQDSMVYRNPRTGEVTKAPPRDASGQKLTEDQIRLLARELRRSGEDSAVFGLAKDRVWLLSFPLGSGRRGEQRPTEGPLPESAPVAPDVPAAEPFEAVAERDAPVAPEPQEPARHEPLVDAASIEIVDLDEGNSAVAHEEVEADAGPFVDEPQEELSMEVGDDAVVHDGSARGQADEALALGGQAIELALAAIEKVMRDWLFAADQPEDFSALVALVSSKRPIPYKQRILSLAEMRAHGAFERPSGEQVGFALETMERFLKEF